MRGAAFAAVGALLVAALVSGCSGSKATTTEPSTGPKPTAADLGTGTGSIAGLVVDDEERPVAGARVQAAPISGSAGTQSPTADVTTGPDGRFTISGLAAGTYFVQLSHSGYEAVQPRKVDVKDGEATAVRVVLLPLPSGDPFILLQSKKSRYNGICYPQVGPLNNICLGTIAGDGQNILNPNDPNRYEGSYTHKNKETEVTPLETILFEARWTDSIPVCKIGTKLDVFSPDKNPSLWYVNVPSSNSADPFFWTNLPDNVTTPIRFEIPRRGESDNAMWGPTRTDLNDGEPIKVAGDWKFRWWSYNAPRRTDPSCAVDVLVEIWFSFHHVDPAPADYSAFPK